MAQKKIPGPVFIIIGAAMVLMSVFIDVQKLTLFILAGAVFIVIGFIKILMKLEEGRKMAERHARHRAAHPHHAAHPQASNPAHKGTHPAHKTGTHHPAHQGAHRASHPGAKKPDYEHKTQTTHVVRCSQCGVKLHHLFKFCPNCGQKLK